MWLSYRELARYARAYPSALTVMQRPSHRNRTGCIEYANVRTDAEPEASTQETYKVAETVGMPENRGV